MDDLPLDMSARKSSAFSSYSTSTRDDSRDPFLDTLNHCFCNEVVFRHCGDDIAHIRSIIKFRINTPNATEPLVQHLADLSQQYVEKFSKRMQILEKRGGEKDHVDETHWAVVLRTTLERPFSSRLALCAYALVACIVMTSVLSVIVQSIPQYNPDIGSKAVDGRVWTMLDLGISTALFTEWLARLVAHAFDPANGGILAGIRGFITSPAALLDLTASVGPLLGIAANLPNNLLNVLALLRVARIFFALRHFDAFEDLEDTIIGSASALVGPFVGLMVVIVFMSSLIYTVESGAFDPVTGLFLVQAGDCEMSAPYVTGFTECPRTESKYVSIPHTMWYSLITVLTVGYGDMVPSTSSGRVISGVLIVLGILFTAMPIAIVGTNFTMTVERLRGERDCVADLMARRDELAANSRSAEAVEHALLQPPATPALALIRFLRLNLEQPELDVSTVTRRVAYFVDIFLARVCTYLMEDDNRAALAMLALRSKKVSRAFSCRLTPCLARPTAVQDEKAPLSVGGGGVSTASTKTDAAPIFSVALSSAKALSVGTSPFADVNLLAAATHAQQLLQRARPPPNSATRSTPNARPTPPLKAHAGKAPIADAGARADGASPTPNVMHAGWDGAGFLATHHCDLTLVPFGGNSERVQVDALRPYFAELRDANGREIPYTTKVSCQLVLQPTDTGELDRRRDAPRASVAVRLNYGVPFVVIDAASRLLASSEATAAPSTFDDGSFMQVSMRKMMMDL